MTWPSASRKSWRMIVPAAVLAVTVYFGWSWWHNRPPYGPEALAIESSLAFAGIGEAQAALGDAGPPAVNDGDRLVLGRVAWQAPPEPLDGGYYAIFLIDKRTDRKTGLIAAHAPVPDALSPGSAGTENRIADRYPWLRGAGDVEQPDGSWLSTGSRLAVLDERATPVSFAVTFPPTDSTVAVSDLLLAMVHMGPDGQVYWARRLQG